MKDDSNQMQMAKEFHAELALVMTKYLAKGIWRPLMLGMIEDIKLAAESSYLKNAEKQQKGFSE